MPTTITGPDELSRLLNALMPGVGWQIEVYPDGVGSRWILSADATVRFRSEFKDYEILDEEVVYRFAKETATYLQKLAMDIQWRVYTTGFCYQCGVILHPTIYRLTTDGEPLCKACYLKEIAP